MCIAILNLKNSLSYKALQNSWNNNDQGAGLLYASDNRLHVYKSYDFKDFYDEYKRVRKLHTGAIVLHFRIATSGHKKWINLHPFIVNDSLGFVHNGIISGLGNNDHSDTFQFNDMLKKLPTDFLQNDTIIDFIEDYIGNSKLIFLDYQGKHTIINEQAGHWFEGNWYSNNSYECELNFVYYGNKKVSKGKQAAPKYDFYDDYDLPGKRGAGDNYNNNYNFIQSMYDCASDFEIQRYCSIMDTDLNDPAFIDDLNEVTAYINSYNLESINDKLEADFFNDYVDEYRF